MALKTITFKEFYRGETKSFGFKFTAPYPAFDWSAVALSCTMTEDIAPVNNATADAVRTNQPLVVDPIDNSALYVFQLTITESNSLTPNKVYNIQAKLTQNGSYVVKPITGKVNVKQDYAI